MDAASHISVRQLHKRYDSVEALNGISFDVKAGEIFGLLGPNGAGKTTTVEILEGLRSRTSGEVEVLGFDPQTQSMELKDKIGVSLQSTNLPDNIKVHEAITLFSSFYSQVADVEPLLERLQLDSKKYAFYSQLSGGQKQRLVLALALINDPDILFLDEPTAGLDPQARHAIHDLVQDVRAEQRTVVLTTHYIEEAERLCDRVAIIDEGQIIAIGTPREIQRSTLGESILDVHCTSQIPDNGVAEFVEVTRCRLSDDRRHLSVTTTAPTDTLIRVVKWIEAQNLQIEDVHLKRPSLEDVFIELTGRSLRN